MISRSKIRTREKCPTCGAPVVRATKGFRNEEEKIKYSPPLQDQPDSWVMPESDSDYD